jgi:hypothetical protein
VCVDSVHEYHVDIFILQVKNIIGYHFCSVINIINIYPKYITDGYFPKTIPFTATAKHILFFITNAKETLKGKLVHECPKCDYPLCALRCVYDYRNAEAFEMSPANFNIMAVKLNLLLSIIISCITTSIN